MHADDLADAVLFALRLEDPPNLMNAGTGVDHSIAEIAAMVREVVGFEGELVYDTSKPDGTPRKLMDVSRMRDAGWSSRISLEEGVRSTYPLFLEESIEGSLRIK